MIQLRTGIRQVMHFFFIPNVEHHVVCLIQKPVGQGQGRRRFADYRNPLPVAFPHLRNRHVTEVIHRFFRSFQSLVFRIFFFRILLRNRFQLSFAAVFENNRLRDRFLRFFESTRCLRSFRF